MLLNRKTRDPCFFFVFLVIYPLGDFFANLRVHLHSKVEGLLAQALGD